MNELTTLATEWRKAKADETEATTRRRKLEDRMLSLIGLPETFEGTENAEAGERYKIKVSARHNQRIDADKLREIAIENGATSALNTLFRWRPGIDAKAWKAADESITAMFAPAITTKPGRPSFSVTDTTEE